jgi:lysyl-tRNA synthetase class 2
VEPTLIQPTFVTDYPVELSPLAKRSPTDPRLVERFEPFLAGMEIGNAFSELNDPDDQRERLLASRRAFEAGDEEAHPLDEDYLRALEVGLPPTGGLGMGVDRLAMILCDAPNLREVIAFPHMRPSAAGSEEREDGAGDGG